MKNKNKFITFGVVLVSILGSALPAYAEEIVISIDGNGSSSKNEVNITSQQTNVVNQSNNSNVENNVEVKADTGNNTASGNSGDTNISTGDIDSETVIKNEDINSNAVVSHSSGSSGNSTISISDNSSKSRNTVEARISNNVTVYQTNNAVITNNVNVEANTGYNTANWNTGDVSINTGHIKAETTVVNERINNSFAKFLGGNCDGSCNITNNALLKIFGNGYGSINNLIFDVDNNKTFNSTNLATIFNDIKHDLNTGGNKANGNLGDVDINTGDIKSVVAVVNKDINSNYVKVECDCPGPDKEKPRPEEPEKEKPTPPPTKSGNGNGHVGGNGAPSGDILGAAVGEVLPVTGSLFLLWATIASLIMFFAGWYLRFRSGCAPGIAR